MFIKFKIEAKLRSKFKAIYMISFLKNTPQKYLTSSSLDKGQIQTLVNFRAFMPSDAKMNFKGSFTNNLWCSVCSIFLESQKYVMECSDLRQKLKDKVNLDGLVYDHNNGTLAEQEQFAKKFTLLLEFR